MTRRFLEFMGMKVAEVCLCGTVTALALFVGVQVHQLRVAGATVATVLATTIAPGVVDSALTSASPGSEPYQRPTVVSRDVPGTEAALDSRELRLRLDQGASGTYIGELLRSRDSSLARWPTRVKEPLRVWIAEPVQMTDWSEQFPSAVRDAFDAWVETGIPMRFNFVYDSANADVHVRFLPKFPSGISGKTLWSRNTRWWLVSGDLVLSLAHPNGGPVTPLQMRAIALHEVGHLLGLDHTEDPTNIMSARIRVRDLSDADRATIRLLYSVPAGTLHDAGADSTHQRTTTTRVPE